MVAGVGDELFGFLEVEAGLVGLALGEVEASVFEVAVGEVEAHGAAGGEGEGFVDVALGCAVLAAVAAEGGPGEEAAGQLVEGTGFPEAIDGLVEVGLRFLAVRRVRAAERESLEGDVQKR